MEMIDVHQTLRISARRLVIASSLWGIFQLDRDASYCMQERNIIISVQPPLSKATWSSWHMFLKAVIFLDIIIRRRIATAVKLIRVNS